MSNKNCPLCSTQLKVIPAGISKGTGKKYPAFYACPNRCNIRDLINTRVEDASKTSYNAQNGTSGASNVGGGVNMTTETIMKLDNLIRKVDLIERIVNAILDKLNQEMPAE